MGSVGAPEVLVILVLALLVLGPERLPQAARTMGRWAGELRRLTGSLQSEVRDVVGEVMGPVNEAATVASGSFTSTFTAAGGTTAESVAERATNTATSPCEAASEPLPAEVPSFPGERAPTLAAPPVDPSLN